MKSVFVLTIRCKDESNGHIMSKNMGCYASQKSLDKAIDRIYKDLQERDFANDLWEYDFCEKGINTDMEKIWNKSIQRRDFEVYEAYEMMFKHHRFHEVLTQEFNVID